MGDPQMIDRRVLTAEEAAAMARAAWEKEQAEKRAAELKIMDIADRHGVSHDTASTLHAALWKLCQTREIRRFAVALLTEDAAAPSESASEVTKVGEEAEPTEDDAAPSKDDLVAMARDLYGETLDKRWSVEKMQARISELKAIAEG